MAGPRPSVARSCRCRSVLPLHRARRAGLLSDVSQEPLNVPRNDSVSRTLVRILLICAGSVAILLPAWLPNRPDVPFERGTVELLQAALLAAAAAVMFGASPHAGVNRPVSRILGLGLLAAVVGELEDFISGILGWNFPEAWVIGLIVVIALFSAFRHRRVVVRFLATLGSHAGAGFVGSALLILYVFNRVVGSRRFWRATLGDSFSPEIPEISKSYLELLACYLIFVGSLGFAVTLARRPEPRRD
jgi:predicted membrane protein